jgi:hypothetical protein
MGEKKYSNIFADSLPTAQKTYSVSNGKARKLMLQRKIIDSFCDKNMETQRQSVERTQNFLMLSLAAPLRWSLRG